ncbi:MAG: CDP-glucose 4,6-dehydratase [Bacteroidetes bacterium]|nr:CDP-glucose 4,6-dehydratase [Bacteroidota bacterium]
MNNLFGGIYNNKTVFITGNTGFKGSWLALWLQKLGAEIIGYSIDLVSSPSHFPLLNLKYKTYFYDILDKRSLEKIFLKHKPEIVFHLAARSLVRESYRNPVETYKVNVTGTLNVFEAARKCGSVKAIVNITTDKVYENLERNISYKEGDPLGGYDMYSSSKACSEIMSASYRRFFFPDHKILLATARAGNAIGGGDWADDRLIPDLMKAVSKKRKISVRNPESIRPWQHVLEPLSGYLLLGQNLIEGKNEVARPWNFGPEEDGCITVSDVLARMKKYWNRVGFRNTKEKNKLHEAGILKLDISDAKNKIKWNPVWNIDRALEKTACWYRNYYENKKIFSVDNIAEYVDDAHRKNLIWTK